MRAITIKDIGKKLGINHSTVSRAINGDPRISEATRKKVMDAVKEMKYTPNLAARGLIRGKSNTIAVVCPSFFANFSMDVMRGIEPEMIKTRYDMTYYSTSRYTTIGTLGKDEYIYEKILNEKKADAIIVINGYLQGGAEIIKRYKKAGIHIVFVEGKGEWGHRVRYDNVAAAEIAVNHLADKGHKRIGLLIGNYDHVESMRERYDGFRNALKKRGLKVGKENIYTFYEAFADVSKNALNQFVSNNIDAVYAGTGDEDAYTLMKEAAKIGIKIPGDLAIVGQDDSKLAQIVGLTTIRQPVTEMGRKAVEIAVYAIDNNEMKRMREDVFYPELVVRKTT